MVTIDGGMIDMLHDISIGLITVPNKILNSNAHTALCRNMKRPMSGEQFVAGRSAYRASGKVIHWNGRPKIVAQVIMEMVRFFHCGYLV